MFKLNIFKWFKLIKWVKNHRKEGNGSFNVLVTSNTFIITVEGCVVTTESWKKNMLRIKY